MKTIRMIFFTALSWSTSSYALPPKDTPRIYFCNNENIQAHIFRKNDGQHIIIIENISQHRSPEKVIEGTVSEMSNKFYTIYTSDDVILKMTKDSSGFMQGTLILTIDDKSSKGDLKCQLVYNI